MDALLRRERLLVGACLAVVVALSWLYLVNMARDMASMEVGGTPDMAMSDPMPAMAGMAMGGGAVPWGLEDLALLFLMWAVMMVAMMVPSAAPMVLAFLSVYQRRLESNRPSVSPYLFVLGYVAVWTAYSALATLAQWGLHEAALISASMTLTSPALTGAILIAAGVYQWTPLKHQCLMGCRSPLSFLMARWREGRWGAWRMGLEHGSYCVGCCWILMALLFATGVMNLAGVALITAFVIAEKLVPRGDLFGKASGVVLAVIGIMIVGRGL